jgi:hypothetical protein
VTGINHVVGESAVTDITVRTKNRWASVIVFFTAYIDAVFFCGPSRFGRDFEASILEYPAEPAGGGKESLSAAIDLVELIKPLDPLHLPDPTARSRP